MVRRVASPELIGRATECRALADALAAAREGRPSLVLIAGEAGIGKTRLVREAERIARADGGLVLTGGAVDLAGGELPYGPIAEALRGLLHAGDPNLRAALADSPASSLDQLLPELAPSVPLGPGPDAAPWLQARTFDAVHDLLRRLAERQPVLLVLEDLHWADRSTRDLLAFLVRALRDQSIVVVATYRSDELHRRHPLVPWLAEVGRLPVVDRLELRRFDRAQLETQLRAILGTDAGPDLVEHIHARSDGNPFFAEELLAVTGHAGEDRLPSGLAEALMARVARLSEPTIEVLGIASVGGRLVDPALLADVSDRPEEAVEAAIDEGLRANILVVEHGEVAFRHALTREAVYDSLMPSRRRRIHARFAEAIATAVSPGGADRARHLALVAHHWDAAAHKRAAFAASVEAAKAATASYAYAEAARQWVRAIELRKVIGSAGGEHPDPVSEVDLFAGAANALDLAGDVELAEAYAHEAITRAPRDDPRVLASLHVLRAGMLWHAYRLDLAIRELETAADLVAEDGPSEFRAEAMAFLASLKSVAGVPSQAIPLAIQAAEMARSLGIRPQEWRATRALALAHLHRGEIGLAIEQFERALLIAQQTGDPNHVGGTYNDLGIAILFRDGPEQAMVVWATGTEASIRLGAWRAIPVVLEVQIARQLIELGRWDVAAEMLARLDGRAPAGIAQEIYRTVSGLLAARNGNPFDDAEVARLLESVAMPSAASGISAAYGAVIELLLARGLVADAAASAAAATDRLAAVEPGSEHVDLLALGLRCEAELALLGRARRDDFVVARARDRITRYPAMLDDLEGTSLVTIGYVRRLIASGRAEAGRVDGEPGSAAWHAVRVAWRDAKQPYFEAYAALREAEALLEERGPRAEAADALHHARAIADHLGARPLLGWIDALAGRARIPTAPPRETPQPRQPVPDDPFGTYGLTRRERETLALLAGGLTNREIAAALFISESTASVHVSNILGKLGVTNRVQAAALASRLDPSDS